MLIPSHSLAAPIASRPITRRVVVLATALAVNVPWHVAMSKAQPPATPQANPPAAMAQDSTALLARLYEQLQSARQQLQESDTGAKTRGAQRSAVSLLDQLIAAAERDEAEQRQGASAAESAGAPRPQTAPESTAPKPEQETPPESRPRRPDNGPPAAWGKLRDRQRDEIFSSVPGRPLPPRYRALVDQYFESFQNDRR